MKKKSGSAVDPALTMNRKKPSQLPVWARTDKGKEFLNKNSQEMLCDEGIHFQVRRNPDVKCADVERAHPMIRKGYVCNLLTKISSDILGFFQNVSGPTMKRFLRRQAW